MTRSMDAPFFAWPRPSHLRSARGVPRSARGGGRRFSQVAELLGVRCEFGFACRHEVLRHGKLCPQRLHQLHVAAAA
jgi:hypothetical protein